jgi:hypothetical protein
MNSLRAVAPALAGLALVLFACGDDDDDSSTTINNKCCINGQYYDCTSDQISTCGRSDTTCTRNASRDGDCD